MSRRQKRQKVKLDLSGPSRMTESNLEELYSKSPAIAAADVLLKEMYSQHQPEPETTLADQFVGSSYTMGKNLHLKGAKLKAFDHAMMLYRDEMRNAHRFVLDDEFTRYATQISSTLTAEKLLSRIQYSTLPYGVTWIEFDMWEKVRTMRAVHGFDPEGYDKANTARQGGILLHRINDTDAVAHMVSGWNRKMVGPHMLAYFFSTRERTWLGGRYAGCVPFAVEDGMPLYGARAIMEGRVDPDELARLGEIGANIGGSMWGFGLTSGIVNSLAEVKSMKTPEFLKRHGTIGFSRLYNLMMEPTTLRTMFDRAAKEETVEFAGIGRWFCTVLGMLNEVPVRANLVQPSYQVRAGLTARKKALDYHRLTLNLPKTKPIPWIQRHLSNAERKHKAHEVRSHWRTYLHDSYCKSDEHSWVYDHDEGYRLCGKCMSYGRLIHEHMRGDPSLGWVRKDYVIKKSNDLPN